MANDIRHTGPARVAPAPAVVEDAHPVAAPGELERYWVEDDAHPTVIVLHASVGSGHRTAAVAIAKAFERLRDEGTLPADLRIELVDCMTENRFEVDGNAYTTMFIGPTRPIYDVTWRYNLTGRILWGGGTVWSRIVMPSFTEHVRKVKPIAVVSTHIMAANAAVGARMITKQSFPVVSVPTDYETEGMWPHLYTDLFCVGTESMAETLRARYVDESRIRVTGIPTREGYGLSYDRDAECERWGLPKDKNVVLVLAGASLPKPYQRFRNTFDATLPYFHRFKKTHFAIVTGRDEEYADRLKALCGALALENVTVMGYVVDMAALMSTANLVVCKAGGLTVTECLNAQVPMILLGKSYGQEKVNVRMLTSSGCALSVTTPRELAAAIDKIETHPEVGQAMRFNESLLSRPDAAADIAMATWELSQSGVPDYPKRSGRRRFLHPYIGDKPAHVR